MKCIIKNKSGAYFNNHLFENQNHWVFKNEAKIFNNCLDARQLIKKYKLKNVELEKIR